MLFTLFNSDMSARNFSKSVVIFAISAFCVLLVIWMKKCQFKNDQGKIIQTWEKKKHSSKKQTIPFLPSPANLASHRAHFSPTDRDPGQNYTECCCCPTPPHPPSSTNPTVKKREFHQSINQSINQSANQPINQSINQPINQSANQTNQQPSNQSINQSIDQSSDQSFNQSINESTNRLEHKLTIGLTKVTQSTDPFHNAHDAVGLRYDPTRPGFSPGGPASIDPTRR